MANLDTAAKRAAGIAATGLLLVLPIADGSDADSIAQRGHLCCVYAANVVAATPTTITGAARVVAGHTYRVAEGHEYDVVAGHVYRVKELS